MSRKLTAVIVTAVALICCFASSASAAYYVTATQGVLGTGLQGSAPGTPFSLDFRAKLPADAGNPYLLGEAGMIFDSTPTHFSQLKVQLDSSPTVFTFLPYPGNQEQVAYQLYDPNITTNIGSGYPDTPIYTPITQEWRDEATDGIIAGHLWVTSPTTTPNSFLFSMAGYFDISKSASAPEPASALGLSSFVLLALARSGRTRKT